MQNVINEPIHDVLVAVFSELFFSVSVDFRFKSTKELTFLTAQVNTHKSVPMVKGTRSQLLLKAQMTNSIVLQSFQAGPGTRVRVILQITSAHWEKNSRQTKIKVGQMTLMKSYVLCVGVEGSWCPAISVPEFFTLRAIFHLSSNHPGKFVTRNLSTVGVI